MPTLMLMGVFLLLLALGIPVGTALGVSGVLALFAYDLGPQMIGVNFVSSIASFPLLAIPFFVLAGTIMERAGLASIVAELFERLLGRRRGGMALVAVATCLFWGALSGSGPATTAAVGLILIAPMVKQGYSRAFAGATIANAADLSIVIPPSIAFIIYGSLTGTSVGALFLAGVIPGLLTGLALMGVAWGVSRRRGYGAEAEAGMSAGSVWAAFRRSFWALLSPAIILGGIYAGIFTPTEAAVVAVFVSVAVARWVYGTLPWRTLYEALVESAVTTSTILFIVAFAGIFSWAASTLGVVDALAEAIVRMSPNAVAMILSMNVLLLALGMFVDAISISYLLLPMMLPVLRHFGVDPVWYGVVFVSALAIGQATPPVGVNLFAAANVAETELDGIAKESLWYVLAAVGVLAIVSIFPALSLYLPSLAGVYCP